MPLNEFSIPALGGLSPLYSSQLVASGGVATIYIQVPCTTTGLLCQRMATACTGLAAFCACFISLPPSPLVDAVFPFLLQYMLEQSDFLVVGVVGKQGVGKSTVMSLLAGTRTGAPKYVIATTAITIATIRARAVYNVVNHALIVTDYRVNGHIFIITVSCHSNKTTAVTYCSNHRWLQ